jgi:hypothetical protein
MRKRNIGDSENNRNDDNIFPIVTDKERSIPLYTGDIESDLKQIESLKDALAIIGGLSITGKMPGPSYNLPASACPTGSKLRNIPGTACFCCYAADDYDWLKRGAKQSGTPYKLNNYVTDVVRNANSNRLRCLRNPSWVPAFVYVIRRGKRGTPHALFRWMSSGDVQSLSHLQNIVTIAENTPDTKHWLPTNEHKLAAMVVPPENMVIRVSGRLIDGPPPKTFLCVSTISSTQDPSHGGFRCPAAEATEYACGDCDACWDSSVPHIDYFQKQKASERRKARKKPESTD